MDNNFQNEKPYGLEERTYTFALNTRLFLHNIKWDPLSWNDVKQLLRSSGSVAANYVEVIESISPADSIHSLRIVKKDARESTLWLNLLNDCNSLNSEDHADLQALLAETNELVKIFASIIRKKSETPLP